ncbi:TPA: Phr family secreted Rap phosphatase inhibitor [Bacillus cereus]|nr:MULTISPECIES: Phr family secreted Rap phosphatase inhibitor [Bacillus cereus group]MBJ8090882.1 Phr family secreted Rap phosphatase inhibitor [Bacillus cereus]MCU4777208.1 Phr family secreted Rap phosphatase inhibitor [Bacillus cereus]MCU4812873.1 Phr family secreted Rap phosphatase inhibitor [Bacillus cereus]MCU4886305.1 Phr family secreted Rap phosphatase inhibitor [Bacillus cereus]MCU4897526.1 Phr family secreted Rap phosphatase inhibitor [Bacillus cereus]
MKKIVLSMVVISVLICGMNSLYSS